MELAPSAFVVLPSTQLSHSLVVSLLPQPWVVYEPHRAIAMGFKLLPT